MRPLAVSSMLEALIDGLTAATITVGDLIEARYPAHVAAPFCPGLQPALNFYPVSPIRTNTR